MDFGHSFRSARATRQCEAPAGRRKLPPVPWRSLRRDRVSFAFADWPADITDDAVGIDRAACIQQAEERATGVRVLQPLAPARRTCRYKRDPSAESDHRIIHRVPSGAAYGRKRPRFCGHALPPGTTDKTLAPTQPQSIRTMRRKNLHLAASSRTDGKALPLADGANQ